MRRSLYSENFSNFLTASSDEIIGALARGHSQDIVHQQTFAWKEEIRLLQNSLHPSTTDQVYFEFVIPRMGRRADVVLVLDGKLVVLEFKVGSDRVTADSRRQLEGYAYDLKNFHRGSHDASIFPILIATNSTATKFELREDSQNVFHILETNGLNLVDILANIRSHDAQLHINAAKWWSEPYSPTPTIIEAAQALYAEHDVRDIARSDAGAKNLAVTSQKVRTIIERSQRASRKSICFVTGVPGSGKTLVGLDLATSESDVSRAVFLSGNGPLVDVLREALVRDEVSRNGLTKTKVAPKVKSFIQNVHHFRDEALQDLENPPDEHVVVFDEAQRAWNREMTNRFMRSKRNQPDFDQSEPEFLLGYLDRHKDWCVVVALVGGGQEINTGEAGLAGWRDALLNQFSHWDIYYSDRLNQAEYIGSDLDFSILENDVCEPSTRLHLEISMRSYRSDRVSAFVHHLIAGNSKEAATLFQLLTNTYPIWVTRNLNAARAWLRQQVKGIDSCGLVASSGALRLKPHGVHVKVDVDAPVWFLNPPDDVRSCHALEDVATEFTVQGLELDWTIVAWDADFRYRTGKFEHWNFRGPRWERRRGDSASFLENAYRVLLTRARQGMVIYVPEGSIEDATRDNEYYDGTFEYLQQCGIPVLATVGGSRLHRSDAALF